MPREISIEAPEGYPLFGWTDEGVRSYIENKPLAVGDVMIIYNGQAGFHEYGLAVVNNPASGKQRESNPLEERCVRRILILSNREKLFLSKGPEPYDSANITACGPTLSRL